MITMRRQVTIAILTGLLAAGAYFFVRSARTRSVPSVSAQGGRLLTIRLPVTKPHFLQRDSQWKDDRIGGSSETLGSVGCTLCSVGTAVRSLGEMIDPESSIVV